ncbi:hypothetical protein [uncultured Roseobacter sp.]|uniref:hypothetical protein n=1 Tax=uncultured Roseobacter sp. TaxID=114847 RepID=UPI002613E464|nr:hypothetical protein [uncultured Roseobacter sp.]
MRAWLSALAALTWAAAAPAQTLISPQAFLDEAVGKTLTFSDLTTNQIVGTEFFISRTESVWEQADGICVRGRITTPDDRICFLYDHQQDREPVCWWPFRHEGRLMVRVARLSDGEIQVVSDISDEPFYCGDVPVS